MRLRLYRLNGDAQGGAEHCPMLIDRFPFSICDPAEWTPTNGNSSGFHECCEISQVSETLFITDTSPDGSTRVNGRNVSVAPMLPGDRIRLDSTEFLVSYERMTSVPPPPAESVIQTVAHTSESVATAESPTINAEESTIAKREILPVGVHG